MKYKRSYGNKKYKSIFHVLTEGRLTEPSYIATIKREPWFSSDYISKHYTAKHSSIPELLKKAEDISSQVREGDQLWVILDRDEQSNTIEQLKRLGQWERENPSQHVALSNPRFEYWLLLHFEKNPTIQNANSDVYMSRYFHEYDKRKDVQSSASMFNKTNVREAIHRACKPNYPTCDNPDCVGSGMGYMMEQFLSFTN